MSEYSSLLSDLSENITNEDLDQLKSACKEDITEDQSNTITSSKEWFNYLEENQKLAQGEGDVSRFPSSKFWKGKEGREAWMDGWEWRVI